jgi:hypothetical protein
MYDFLKIFGRGGGAILAPRASFAPELIAFKKKVLDMSKRIRILFFF